MKKVYTIGILSSLLCGTAEAGNLAAPIDLPSTKVLPKGVRNVRFKGVLVEATNKYDTTGTAVPLGDALNTSVTWNKMIDGKDTAVEKNETKGYIRNHLGTSEDAALDEEVGQTTGVANVAVTARVPVFAWGASKRWTLGAAIPIINSKVNVDTGFLATERLNAFREKMISEGKLDPAQELTDKTADPIQEKLRDYNYKSLQDEEKTQLGDIKIVSKYQFRERPTYAMALTNEIVLPTGKVADQDKVIDVPSGDGQWDAGVGLVTDWYLGDYWTVTHSLNYIRQFKTTRGLRVPEKDDTTLTPDKDPNVSVDLGDIFQTQLGVVHKMPLGFNVGVGYGFQYKEQDVYSGSEYESGRYRYLSFNTRQNMQTLQASLGYSTLDLFREKKFFMPLGATLSYTDTLAGKNVTKNPVTSFDFYMFF